MVDYVFQSVDLDVFGGPTTLDVSTDFGAPGDRGSRIWAGNGNPASILASQDVALYDMFINTNVIDQYYSWLYQYVPDVGGTPVWSRVLKLNPQQYSKISTVSFTTGEATLDLPLSSITTDTAVTTSQFIIRYNLENGAGNPVASSFTYSIETVDTVKVLRIVFSGVEYSGSTWAALTGSHKVHTFVSYLS